MLNTPDFDSTLEKKLNKPELKNSGEEISPLFKMNREISIFSILIMNLSSLDLLCSFSIKLLYLSL